MHCHVTSCYCTIKTHQQGNSMEFGFYLEDSMFEGLTGLFGVLIGGGITYYLQKTQYDRETRQQREWDEFRRALLKEMLDDPKWQWRSMATMSRVIGTPTAETARLLIGIGARGSTKEDGMWGYKTKHLLPSEQ